jgi:hypothetical protein
MVGLITCLMEFRQCFTTNHWERNEQIAEEFERRKAEANIGFAGSQ